MGRLWTDIHYPTRVYIPISNNYTAIVSFSDFSGLRYTFSQCAFFVAYFFLMKTGRAAKYRHIRQALKVDVFGM